MSNISIAMATYNEAENLRMSLPALKGWVDEIVIVDGGSTDKTVYVARQFGAKVIVTDNPPIFHINKQKALDACAGKWILQLDADEVVSDELREELLSIAKKNTEGCAGYYIARKNFFLGHWIRKGGQYPDYVIRFFLRGKGKFPAKSVHEQIAISGTVGHLKNPLFHYSYRTLGEYMMKAHRYSQLEAKKMQERNVPINLLSYLQYNTILPLQTFFNLFFVHKGFIDGLYGFLYAALSGMHHSMAYMKYKRMTV